MKSRGPITEPCGTPVRMGRGVRDNVVNFDTLNAIGQIAMYKLYCCWVEVK